VPADALLLALAAAVVHAAWNLLLSDQRDVHAATAVAACAGAVAFAPVAALTWRVPASAWPYVAASGALELIYLALLATGYARAAMGLVYPVARGSAPVLVLLAGVVVLGTRASALAAVGVVLVGLGIVLVRGLHSAVPHRDLALALAIGACIASYTLVDKRGVAHAAPFAYLEVVFAIVALGYLAGALRARGGRALLAAANPASVAAGLGFFGAYGLTLAALRLAPAASVAAVRECSVVIAAAALAISGRERTTAERLCGAVLVAAGVAAVSVG
jgi:drug/metabolite transporter (DMT)-like permease